MNSNTCVEYKIFSLLLFWWPHQYFLPGQKYLYNIALLYKRVITEMQIKTQGNRNRSLRE